MGDETGGQVARKLGRHVLAAGNLALRAQIGDHARRQDIHNHRRAFGPVGRSLEDRGARQAAMGEQQRFLEHGAVRADPRRRRHTRDFGKAAICKSERHQRGAGGCHGNTELARHIIGEARSAHFGDGFAACRDDQAACGDAVRAVRCGQGEGIALVRAADIADRTVQPQIDIARGHEPVQHGDDVLGGIVAKELAQRFLVPRNAVCLDQCDEIPLGIARQRRFGEMRVGADEGLWIGV